MTDHLKMPGRRTLLVGLPLTMLAAMFPLSAHAAFDHRHSAWDTLLKQHVAVAPGGNASTLRYSGLQAQRDILRAYLGSLSAVPTNEYSGWSRPQQLAFLINAYNAYTVELILTRYPNLQSIKDLGGLLQSPWKKNFFRLLGQERSLDDLEHDMIRAPGIFDDPRIHVAVVCASIGCPMLRNEAFVPERLDFQLDDALHRFLSDRSRNRFDAVAGTLAVSKIFDWYRKDFEQGYKGYGSLQTFFARHAGSLAFTAQMQAEIRAGRYKLAFLDYNWALNDARQAHKPET